MVPTDPPRLEDRNVRWCHCACREPRLSPVPCCSAWRSCSRGRMRWPEWKWQEHLCEREDTHLWWLLLNKYLPYLCSDDCHLNGFKLSSTLGFYLPPIPLTKRQEHITRHVEILSAVVLKSPSPRLKASSAALCLCKASSPDKTMCCTAARLHFCCTLCSRCFLSRCFSPLLFFVISAVVIPSLNPLSISPKYLPKKLLEELHDRKAFPIHSLYHSPDSSLLWLCYVSAQGGCWHSSERCWNTSVELVRLMRLIFPKEIH